MKSNRYIKRKLTQIITIIVRILPASLSDVDVTTTGWYVGNSRVAIFADVVTAGYSSTARIVTVTDATSVESGSRVEHMIAASSFAQAIDTDIVGVWSASRAINHLVT